MDFGIASVVVPAIALIAADIDGCHARKSFCLFQCPSECVSIVRITMESLSSYDSIGLAGRDKTGLAAEFISLVCFPFGKAFHLRCMYAVKLVLARARLSQQAMSKL